jgi:dihydroorotase
LSKAAAAAQARVYPIGAVSRGSKGEQLADLAELRAAGCVAVSDDGYPVADALLMRRALEYASSFGMPVIDHCEDPALRGGVAHEGFQASALGLRGLPAVAEELIVERDVTIAGLVGAPVHVAHMSVQGSLRAVRSGKDRDIPVTCEVTPHHFILTDEVLQGYDTNTKMNPPLREVADRDTMLQGLADGSIDVIATDHAPHHYDEKAVEFDRAPFGITGLETAVSLSLDRLVKRGVLSLNRLVELYSTNPARILGVAGGTLETGAPADLTVIAPDIHTTIDTTQMRSKAKNTPFDGWELCGSVAATIVSGRVLYVNDTVAGANVFSNEWK